MAEHLPVIPALLLCVDDEDLVEPPSKLSEIVEFGKCRKEDDGIGSPELLWGERGGLAEEDELASDIQSTDVS